MRVVVPTENTRSSNGACARASQEAQLVNMACDSSGFCQFISPTLDDIREFYGQLYGIAVSREEIANQGWECLADEWAFNAKAGWRDEDNGVARCLVEEGIGPGHSMKFDVPLEIINQSKVRFPVRDELFAIKASGCSLSGPCATFACAG